MVAVRTKRPDARAAIADAAFVRSCGNFYAAMQPASLKRPFKATISVGFKPTFRHVMFEFTDRGTNRTCAAAANAHAEIARMPSITRLLTQHVSPNRTFKQVEPG
jgi:hypothetical protein